MEDTRMDKPVTQDELYFLVKVLREYRATLPEEEEYLKYRHKINLYEDILNFILEKGIDAVIKKYIYLRDRRLENDNNIQVR